MFIGEYHHAIDEKGRLAVPVKFRAAFARHAVVTRGLDNCLFLFTKKEWEKLAVKLAALPIAQANSRAFARLMLAGAMDVELDGQGRVIVPDYLRSYANLGKPRGAPRTGQAESGFAGKVVLAGLYNRLELWSEANWSLYKNNAEKTSGAIAEALGELGV